MDNFEITLMWITKHFGKLFHLVQVETLPLFGVFFAEDGPAEYGVNAIHVSLFDIGHSFSLPFWT